jgi:hypothetical protein
LLQQYNYEYQSNTQKNLNPRLIESKLPPGIYKVGISANYFNDDSYLVENTLTTEIEITLH